MLKKATILLLPAALALAACGNNGDGANGEGSGDRPQIITSFYALEYAAKQVAGEHADVVNLTQPGVESHYLDLTPSQIADMAKADLVVYLSEFQPAVDEAVAQTDNDRILDVAPAAQLLEADEHADHGHGDDDHGDHDHADHDHDHDHGEHDPHFWQDPTRMSLVGNAIAERLSEQFPDHADDFAAGAKQLADEMAALDEEFTEGLGQCERDEFITTHQAFTYLTERYGLTEIAVGGINPEGEPSPARVAEVHRIAKEYGVTTIFFETLTSPKTAEAIAGDLGLKTAVLDPLEGLAESSPGEDYPSIMRANLEELKKANDCR